MLKVLTKRIEAKAQHLIGRTQFGFRKGCGTRDAIGVIKFKIEFYVRFKVNAVSLTTYGVGKYVAIQRCEINHNEHL